MRHSDGHFQLTATDLVAHSACNHLITLEKQVAQGKRDKPDHYDPLLEILRERGQRHEQGYFDHLQSAGLDVTSIDGVEVNDHSVSQTIEAMKAGAPIIAQGALKNGSWPFSLLHPLYSKLSAKPLAK